MNDMLINDEVLKLKNQLCFPLYAAAKSVVKQYTPYLNEIGLTYTQYITMMVLWERGRITVKDLGKQLYLDSGTLTPLLKRLESKELITRTRATSGDERIVDIAITPQGEKLKEKAIQIPHKISKCVSLPRDDVQTLYKLLYDILGQLENMERHE